MRWWNLWSHPKQTKTYRQRWTAQKFLFSSSPRTNQTILWNRMCNVWCVCKHDTCAILSKLVGFDLLFLRKNIEERWIVSYVYVYFCILINLLPNFNGNEKQSNTSSHYNNNKTKTIIFWKEKKMLTILILIIPSFNVIPISKSTWNNLITNFRECFQFQSFVLEMNHTMFYTTLFLCCYIAICWQIPYEVEQTIK